MHYVKNTNKPYKRFYLVVVTILLGLITISFVRTLRKEPLFADVNQDGVIDISDMMLMRAHQLGNRKMTKKQQRIADVNRDGEINEVDFEIIRAVILSSNGYKYEFNN